MSKRLSAFVLLLAVVTGTTLVAGQVRTPLSGAVRPQLLGVGPYVNADALFADDVLHDIHMVVSSSDWQSLKNHYLDNTYYPADFQWRDQVVRNVGIRSRGTGSRSPIKPGLGVSFDRYTTDQKFLGLKSVVLRNNTQDASNIHERVGMLLSRRMGLPASREAHTRLFVNNEYVGLYTIVESLDKKFLKRTFGDDGGYLYSYEYPADAAPYYFEYRGSNPDAYVPIPFTPETHENDPRADVIEQFIWTINEANNGVFRTAISEFLDIGAFIRHVAVDMFIAENDGVLGDWGMNNLYLYRLQDRKLFTFITWDKSEAFKGGASFSIFHNINNVPLAHQNRLMRRVLSYPDLYDLYLETLLECARSAGELTAGTTSGAGWLEGEVQREYQQIRQAALADPVKPFTNDEFERAVSDVMVFARQRGAFVTSEVERVRPQRLSLLPRSRVGNPQ